MCVRTAFLDSRFRGSDRQGVRAANFNFGHFFRLTVAIGQQKESA
jgi:hypothetical protein